MPMVISNDSVHRSALARHGQMALVVLLGALLLLTGCNRQADDSYPPAPDLLDTLPADWVVIPYTQDTWLQVNIDDDTQVEYLLFYTYSNQTPDTLSGPVGASIFDLQNNAKLVPRARTVSMPFQPSGSFVPYRILPNYWQGSGTGFIAPSGRQDFLTVTPIARAQERTVPLPTPTPEPGTTPTPGPTPTVALTSVPVQELMIEDDGTAITVVWWRNLIDGYGAANVHAEEGFKGKVYEDDDTTAPLIRFNGYHPFHDRSELCYVTLYERTYLTETITLPSGEKVEKPTVNIFFDESPLGIQYCGNPPSAPFYPEAFVLSYFFDAESGAALLDSSEANTKEVAVPLADAIRDGSKRMVGLYGPSLIRFDNVDESPASVCLSVIDAQSNKLEAYRFRLKHVAPSVDDQTTDRFKIVNVQPIPAPPGGPPVDCNTIVENGTPGRVPAP